MKQQKHKLIKRVLSIVLSLSMALCLIPSTVFAAEGDVAKIGDTTYATLDGAVEAATDGATIELLADATTNGLNLSKKLTIKAAEGLAEKPTITFTQYGIALWGKALTFENCNVVMNGIGSTPYTAEWGWTTICASKDASLTLNNVNMTMDATGTTNSPHAIYFCNNNVLNIENNSNLTIKNYANDALEWDGGNGGYNVNITNSTYISDNNRSGFTGTFYATIDQSTVKVLNSTGNGSNGTYYTIQNNSKVVFDNNETWGISAYRIDMTNNSSLTATNNGYSGVWTRILNVDETCTLEVLKNGYSGSFTGVAASTSAASNAGISFYGNGTYVSEIKAGADVTIKNNAGPGIATLQGVANLTIGSATITNNGSYSAKYGGGLYNIGTVALGADVVIYNNHANTAGDDIYFAPTSNARTVSFGEVGNKWALDGDPDCEHLIDGWYDDSEGTRWEAHAATEDGNHIKEFTGFGEDGLATVSGLTALKAAHGIDAQDKTSYPGMDKVIVSNGEEVTNDSVAAGDTVNFKLESNVPDDLTNYIIPDVKDPEVVENEISTLANVPIEDRGEYSMTIHDQMDGALSLNPESIEVKIGDTVLESQYYMVNTSTTDGCDFEITMDLIALYKAGIITEEDIANATPITVTYTATLSASAVAGSYENTAWVTYPTGESEKPIVTVDTYGITIFKYDSANPETGLSGAVFEIYQKDESGAVITDSKVELTSGDDGYATLDGLDSGTYYIKETKAPEGYVCSDQELTVTIPDQAGTDNVVTVNFANTQIPHTGGMGTTLYTVGGGLIVAAAAVLFVVSRKKRQSK